MGAVGKKGTSGIRSRTRWLLNRTRLRTHKSEAHVVSPSRANAGARKLTGSTAARCKIRD
jgi:hypothetical protein